MKLFLSFLMLLGTLSYGKKIGEIKTSGLLFKDRLEVHVFKDPDIKGVVCYITTPKRALSFVDQTDSSISCRKVAKINGKLYSRKRIFKKSKSWLFKSLYVDRIFDRDNNVLVYVSYTSKLSGDNANNSISVVALTPNREN